MNGSICILSPKSTDACSLESVNEYAVGSTCSFQPFNKPANFTATYNTASCNSGNFNEAWGWFTATAEHTVVTFDPDGTERPILHVFTGNCGSLTEVGCHNGGANGVNAEVLLSTVPGQVYRIRIQRHAASTVMHGGLCVYSPSSTNDCTFSSQNQFTPSSDCTFQPFQKPESYTASLNPGGCNSGNVDDAWGWFTATSPNTVITFSPDLAFRPILHVFSGVCGSLVQLACHDAGALGANASVTVTTTVGTQYAFRVQRQGSNVAMDGGICIWDPSTGSTTNGCATTLSNKYNVTSTCSFQPFNKPASYTASMDPGGCNSGNFADAWGWFTATGATTIITFDPDLAHRPILHLFSGPCNALVQVACHDGGANGINAEILFNTTPGVDYTFRVQRQGTSDAMNGGICIWTPNTTDVCAFVPQNKLDVTSGCGFQAVGKPASYDPSFNPGGCNSGNFDDAWMWFTATSTRTAITYDPDAVHRPVMHVFTGTCGSLSQVACDDGGATGINAEVLLNTVIGQDYMIRIQRQGSSLEMSGGICIRAALANDECGMPTALPVLENCFAQTFSNNRATRSLTTPNATCGGTVNNNTQQDVWFSFVAPASGQVIIESGAGTLGAAAMQLYSGNCGSLIAMQCSTTGGPGGMPRMDRTCDLLTPGATYRIRFWGTGGGTGTFTLCVYGPDTYTPRFEDCVGSIPICGDQSINNNASNVGCTQDLNTGNRGCLLSNERQGSWYTFSPSASGTMEFTITPNGNVDYDFAIWGPMNTFACPPAGTPLRCSYAWPNGITGYPAASTFLTGMRAGNFDTSEPATGTAVNGFVAPINVIAGEVYILYVDNFTSNGQSFTLNWTLTNGCSLDCNVLPIELTSFGAEATHNEVVLQWTTMTEVASSHFVVERSSDGSHFTAIGEIAAAGYSLSRLEYRWFDADPLSGVSYYRLKQVDLDGMVKYSELATVVFKSRAGTLLLYPNPAFDHITLQLPGMPEGSIDVLIWDASGRMVLSSTHAIMNGGTRLELPLHALDVGSYSAQLVFQDGSTAGMGRFVKQ